MLLFANYHYSERTWVTDWWRKTPDKSFLSTSVFVTFLLSYSLTLRQLRSYSLTWGSCSYSVTSNNRKRLLKIAQCKPGFTSQICIGSKDVWFNRSGYLIDLQFRHVQLQKLYFYLRLEMEIVVSEWLFAWLLICNQYFIQMNVSYIWHPIYICNRVKCKWLDFLASKKSLKAYKQVLKDLV